jgi:hypothetical protein
MKLSDAVMLGFGMIKFNPRVYLQDGCGCFLGSGYFAVTGAKKTNPANPVGDILREWPWLEEIREMPDWFLPHFKCRQIEAHRVISMMAFNMRDSQVTLEQAVDWIRSVEPAEPNPAEETVMEGETVSQER